MLCFGHVLHDQSDLCAAAEDLSSCCEHHLTDPGVHVGRCLHKLLTHAQTVSSDWALEATLYGKTTAAGKNTGACWQDCFKQQMGLAVARQVQTGRWLQGGSETSLKVIEDRVPAAFHAVY